MSESSTPVATSYELTEQGIKVAVARTGDGDAWTVRVGDGWGAVTHIPAEDGRGWRNDERTAVTESTFSFAPPACGCDPALVPVEPRARLWRCEHGGVWRQRKEVNTAARGVSTWWPSGEADALEAACEYGRRVAGVLAWHRAALLEHHLLVMRDVADASAELGGVLRPEVGPAEVRPLGVTVSREALGLVAEDVPAAAAPLP